VRAAPAAAPISAAAARRGWRAASPTISAAAVETAAVETAAVETPAVETAAVEAAIPCRAACCEAGVSALELPKWQLLLLLLLLWLLLVLQRHNRCAAPTAATNTGARRQRSVKGGGPGRRSARTVRGSHWRGLAVRCQHGLPARACCCSSGVAGLLMVSVNERTGTQSVY
jgi:hypothetical protein